MKDLISVVVPIYNVEQYLEKCLDSVLDQTYQKLEIILVDDGSIDCCSSICDQYAVKDKRIKVIHQKNGGLSAARNRGIKEARGKYITFIDSDDIITNDCIEYLYYLLIQAHTKMSICAYSIINSHKTIDLGAGYQDGVLSREDCLKRMLCEEGFTVSSCAKLYQLDLFDHVLFPISKLCEDNGTTYKLIDQCDYIAYGHESKYYYFRRSGSIMKSSFHRKKLDLIELSDEMCDFLEKYSSLKEVLNKKRFVCRCSILRQISESKNEREYFDLVRKLIEEIKQLDLNHNRLFTVKDKVALYSLKFGYYPFKYIWRFYSRLRYGE